MTSYSRNLDCFSKKNMTNFQVGIYFFREDSEFACRVQNCHNSTLKLSIKIGGSRPFVSSNFNFRYGSLARSVPKPLLIQLIRALHE